ncbi:MAG: hypothetical protein AB7N76_23170 [Planctomycetota bacterium]
MSRSRPQPAASERAQPRSANGGGLRAPSTSARGLGWSLLTLLALLPAPARAQQDGAVFRGDEVQPRDFAYNDEYFVNVLNYRQRLSSRWRLVDAAVAYDITAGSLRNDELYVNQRARLRLPFSDVLTGEYRFVQWEDYDARFQRHEVELLARVLRPTMRLPLLATVGRTPPPDGLFFGGQGVLEQRKERADMGLVLGYRNALLGARVDALAVDLFFNEKAKQNAEYTSRPYTLRATTWLDLLGGDLSLEGWFNADLPLRLVQPAVSGGQVFRYRQLRSGLNARWRARHDLRVDLELWLERTRKRRAANDPDPLASDRTDREAGRATLQAELDVPALWGPGASREADTWFFTLHVHLLDETTRRPRAALLEHKDEARRREAYAEVGYVLALPSPSDHYRLGVRVSGIAGFLSHRDVRPLAQRRVIEDLVIGKLCGGLEVGFRQDQASAFFQLTWRVDDQTFGGGNVQVQMTF